MSIPTHADVAFPVTGTTIPLDHGYALYAALSHRLPALHDQRGWAVHPIRGQRAEPGILALLPRGAGRSAVKLRLPVESLPQVLSLVGRTLDLHGESLGGGIRVHLAVMRKALNTK